MMKLKWMILFSIPRPFKRGRKFCQVANGSVAAIFLAFDIGLGHWLIHAVAFACLVVHFAERYPVQKALSNSKCHRVLRYLQSLFGVYSLRIENIGVRWPLSDDVQIRSVANPSDFRKAVLTQLSNMRSEAFSRQASAIEEIPNSKMTVSSLTWV